MENVLLSPHTADHVKGFCSSRGRKVSSGKLRRFQANEPLLNLVDNDAGT